VVDLLEAEALLEEFLTSKGLNSAYFLFDAEEGIILNKWNY